MSKVITFSRTFPAYHPKAGQPTYFVEKLWNSIDKDANIGLHLNRISLTNLNDTLDLERMESFISSLDLYSDCSQSKKHHTIRAGSRWKVGDKFSPRVWSGRPYNSPQITIAPDIEVVKVWDIGLVIRGDHKEFVCGDTDLTGTSISKIAENDGLSVNDLFSWFNRPFTGQIICWNPGVNY